MRHIIIDGYNVIRASPRFAANEHVSLEYAREVLVQAVASSPGLTRDQVMIVFDGTYGNRSHVQTYRRGNVLIMYSAQLQSADDVVVAQARTLATQAEVVVVSNDREVCDRCRDLGARISSAENLLGQMPGPQQRRRLEPPEEVERGLSTKKQGNPRRKPRRSRQEPPVRF